MEDNQALNAPATNQAVGTAEASEMEGKYLSFWIEQQLFGLPIADVVQIVGVQEITELPEVPQYVKGIINLRGSIIPIIDVRIRLGKPQRDYDERTCIIVTSIHDSLMGFVVDAVDEVANIDNSEVSPLPQINGNYSSTFLTGVAKHESKVVLLISVKKLIGENEVNALSQVIGGGDF